MFWKLFKKIKEPSLKATANPTAGLSLPLTFLQKLVPIGELPADELQAQTISLRHFGPGEVVFNRGEISNDLIYLYEGEIYFEAINGSGYTIKASTLKGCYPISTSTEQCFTAIAKSPAKAIYFPLAILKQSSTVASAYNPLNGEENIPLYLRESEFFKGFCRKFRNNQLLVPTFPDVALQLRKALNPNYPLAILWISRQTVRARMGCESRVSSNGYH